MLRLAFSVARSVVPSVPVVLACLASGAALSGVGAVAADVATELDSGVADDAVCGATTTGAAIGDGGWEVVLLGCCTKKYPPTLSPATTTAPNNPFSNPPEAYHAAAPPPAAAIPAGAFTAASDSINRERVRACSAGKAARSLRTVLRINCSASSVARSAGSAATWAANCVCSCTLIVPFR